MSTPIRSRIPWMSRSCKAGEPEAERSLAHPPRQAPLSPQQPRANGGTEDIEPPKGNRPKSKKLWISERKSLTTESHKLYYVNYKICHKPFFHKCPQQTL